MLITIVNEAEDLVANASLLEVIRAITRQVFYDFEPYWHLSARLRLSVHRKRPASEFVAPPAPPREGIDLGGQCNGAVQQMDPVAGGALLILQKWAGRRKPYEHYPYCYGFHDMDSNLRLPVGYVFVTEEDGRPRQQWSVTLSHEILELIANPHVNILVDAPHPHPGSRPSNPRVFVEREVCDPVKDSRYTVDGVPVSNFVLPLYFLEDGDQNERVDFLGELDAYGQWLTSFGMMPGGYVPYYDPGPGAPGKKLVGRKYTGEYYDGEHIGVAAHLPKPRDLAAGPSHTRTHRPKKR
jgi:hypothetical protein